MAHAFAVPPPPPVLPLHAALHAHPTTTGAGAGAAEQQQPDCPVHGPRAVAACTCSPTTTAVPGCAAHAPPAPIAAASSGYDASEDDEHPAHARLFKPQPSRKQALLPLPVASAGRKRGRGARGPRTASGSAQAAAPVLSRANAWARLLFRRTARRFGLNPAAVAGYFKPLPAADVEELKKMFVPLSSLVSMLLVFLGPTFAPTLFGWACAAVFTVTVLVNYSHLVRCAMVVVRLRKTAYAWAANPTPAVPFSHVHAIILPNYKEPLSLLRATLRQLAAHRHARTHYLVVLAMEQAEGSDARAKATALTREFASLFHGVLVTHHPANLPGECRGKGANVAWAAARVDDHVKAREASLPAHRVILTVADADAGLPELYFSEVEREMVQRPAHGAHALADAQFRLFAPPIFFARNPQKVPALVRATDAAWSVAFMQNLASAKGLHFPCSSYSVTLPLARHVGGWDPTADAIGEDMHMLLKCFYKTRGVARATPIHCPVNLANVQAGGYAETLGARFTQARRHFAGSADSLYAMRHAIWPGSMDLPPPPAVPGAPALDAQGFKSYRFDRFLLFMHVLEAHMVPATSWLSMLALPLTSLINPDLMTTPMFNDYLTPLGPLMVLPFVLMAFMYEYTHRMLARTGLIGSDIAAAQRTRRWYNVFDYALLPLCAIGYVAAPATSHCSNALRILLRRGHKEFQYVVAQKGPDADADDDTLAAAAAAVPVVDEDAEAVALESVVVPPAIPRSLSHHLQVHHPALTMHHPLHPHHPDLILPGDSASAHTTPVLVPSGATSPPLSDGDSAIGDAQMPATPSSIWAAAAKARAAAALASGNGAAASATSGIPPRLMLPPAASEREEATSAAAAADASEPCEENVPLSGSAAPFSMPARAKGHSKHLSTDSAFFEPSRWPTPATLPTAVPPAGLHPVAEPATLAGAPLDV